MANYYGNRGNGSSLRHYRTKGSRNGYSKDPNYNPVGQKATGRIVNGRYVYDADYEQARNQATVGAARAQVLGKMNNWQQQSNLHRSTDEAANRYVTGRSRDVMAYNESNATKNADKKYVDPNSGWKFDYSYRNANQRVANGAKVSNPTKVQMPSAKSKRNKLIAKGAQNNWQDMANRSRAANEAWNNVSTRKSNGLTAFTNASDKSLDRDLQTRYGVNGKGDQLRNDTSYANALAKNNVRKQHAAAKDNWQQKGNKAASRGTTNSAINYGTDPRYTLSENQKKAKAKLMDQKDFALKNSILGDGIPGAMKDQFSKGYERGVDKQIAATTRDKLQEAEGIARFKADVDKQWRESHKIKAAVKDAKIKASQTAHKAKKETKKLINKGKNTVNNLLKKFKKK